jgi:signal transduction histidine kinase
MTKFFWSFVLFSFNLCFGQNKITEYYEYSISNGLVDNWVNDFEKDQEGFIWIATNDGISRFDGYNFINFSGENQILISHNTSFHDLQLHGDKIYAISREKGIYTLNTKTLDVNHIEKKGVVSFDKLGNETLIYFSNGLLVLKEGNSIKSQKQFNKPAFNGKGILTKDKIILNNSFASVFILDKQMNILDHPLLKEQANGISLFRNPKLGVLFSTSKGAFRLIGNHFKSFDHQYTENKLSFFNVTSDGKPFYILNFKQPFMPLNNSRYCFSFDKTQNIEVRTIHHLGKDYWLIGTNQGFYKLNIGNRFNMQIKDDLFDRDQIRVRRKIVSTVNNLFLFGFPGIISYNLKSKQQEYFDKEKRELSSYDALRIRDIIYATSEGYGFWKMDLSSNEIKKITTGVIGPLAYYHCIFKVNDDQLIMGGNGEIIRYDFRNGESEKFKLNSELEILDFEFSDKKLNYLIATNKGLFSVKLPSVFTNNETSQLKVNRIANIRYQIKDIHRHSNLKNYWLATDQGVFILDRNLLKLIVKYEEKNEISNPKVTGLLEDSNGKIWASTYSGITCFDLKNFKKYFITTKHGLANSEFNYKSFDRLSDGRLIFGGLFGYDIVDPKLFDFNISQAKIVLAGYKTEKEGFRKQYKIKKGSSIEFNTGEEDLLLYFITTDFNNAEMYSVEYKINDGEWLQLTNNNVLRISDLKGGKNKLQIRLKDSFSNICDAEEYAINAKIPFYHELYFYVFISILIATLSFLAVYYFNRMRHVEVETKKRISMDLHDETGTILTRVLLMSKNELMIIKNIDLFQSSLKDALFSLRTFMDSLSGKRGYLSDLLIELKEFISVSFRGATISAQLSTENIDNIWLSSELYRDIKLCMYEAIQNTLKHSNASEFKVKIYQKNKRLLIEISDNGETNLSLEELEDKGNGFRNFQKRTNRHKGSVKIDLLGEKKSVHLFFDFPLK